MRLFTVDAFTDKPFKGNPAGVCVLGTPFKDEASYLKISQEINYAETAFVYPEKDYFQLRWFTPTTEVKLCGHATLAAAKILFDIYKYSGLKLSFKTQSGFLNVVNNNSLLEMDFPIGILRPSIAVEKELISFLPKKIIEVQKHNEWRIVQLQNEKAIHSFNPNFYAITKTPIIVVITAKSETTNFDFVSRVFAPYYGIEEDSVTGSAHCYLANYWSNILNKKELIAYQASKRSGRIDCEIKEPDRVFLKGNAIIMSEIRPNRKL